MKDKERAELELRRNQMKRYPFCPDHRDKVFGKRCRECEIEKMSLLLKAAYHLLMAATGPGGGPTDWNETRQKWIDRYTEGKEQQQCPTT